MRLHKIKKAEIAPDIIIRQSNYSINGSDFVGNYSRKYCRNDS